ncbi:MAG: hypothetical protein QNJ98_18275 [Planctomycetota bacterium]|nr:hypothetical protein [Planctomycetota bacterium]
MQEAPDPQAWSHRRKRTLAAFFAGALCACAAWYLLGRSSDVEPEFVPPSGSTSAYYVRSPLGLTRLAQLGFEDALAWEIGAAEGGWLTTTLLVSDTEGVEVRVPMAAGTTATIWYRLQPARSGLENFLDLEDERNPVPPGEYGWSHPSDRWTFTLTVLFARLPAWADSIEFAARAVRGVGTGLKYVSWINQSPSPFRLSEGRRAYVSVTCTPSGPLAIPAEARVADMSMDVLPLESWTGVGRREKPIVLRRVDWATRDASGAKRAVGAWGLVTKFEVAE